MLKKDYDSVVIGGGSAGMAAAIEIAKNGFKVAIIEREDKEGGILLQCIHNGFGLHRFKEELTGPEYAYRFEKIVKSEKNIDIYTKTTVLSIQDIENEYKTVVASSDKYGVIKFITKTIALASGCRERNRGNIGIPGTRPAGIFTAGLAQRLVNIEGLIPGKEVVIIGSGDIGLIMARRMSWVGANVKAVIEIQPYPSGLTRNIVQCLNDFNIPLYLSHVVSKIYGKDRVESVDITPIEDGKLNYNKTFNLKCDTLLLSVGLIPDTELATQIGVKINPETNGPFVDASLMTNVEGVFACGNVLHVHDLVDFVTEESERCGKYISNYLNKQKPEIQYPVKASSNIKYVVPNKYTLYEKNKFYMRAMVVKNFAKLIVKINSKIIKKVNLTHVQPSEMISLTLKSDEIKPHLDDLKDNKLEFSIE